MLSLLNLLKSITKRIYNSYNLARKYLKENPAKLLSKLYLIFFVPFVLVLTLVNRLKTYSCAVYLLDMELKPTEVNDIKFEIYDKSNLDLASDIAIKRQSENSSFDDNYTDTVIKRLNRGDFLICFKISDKTASFLFLSEKRAILEQVNEIIELPTGFIAIYDVYTFKEFRGKGFYGKLFNAVCIYEFNRGFKNCYLWVMKHNRESVIVHNKIGMKSVIKEFKFIQKYGFRTTKSVDVNYNSLELISND